MIFSCWVSWAYLGWGDAGCEIWGHVTCIVLGVVGVPEHLLDRLARGGAEHREAHRDRRRLARHRAVVEQHALELLVQRVVLGAHGGDADAEGGAVLHHLVGAGVAQRVQQVRADLSAVVGVDDAQREERAALTVRRRRHPRLRQVRLEELERLLDVALVDHAERRRRRELGPVGRARQPLEVVAEEGVGGGARGHQRVGEDDARVVHRVALLDRLGRRRRGRRRRGPGEGGPTAAEERAATEGGGGGRFGARRTFFIAVRIDWSVRFER